MLDDLEALAARLRHRPMFTLAYGAEGYEVTVFTRPYDDPDVRVTKTDAPHGDFGTIRVTSLDSGAALARAARLAAGVAVRQGVPA